MQIARVHYERAKSAGEEPEDAFEGFDGFVNGLLSCDGMNSSGQHNADIVLWFLNMASAYRDMDNEGLLKNFNYKNHTTVTYWMLGCSGPFGIINVGKGKTKSTYKIWRLHQEVALKQSDG